MKTILISGNYNNIGLAMGLRYADSGANVILLIDKNETYNEPLLEEAQTKCGQFLLKHIDLRDEQAIQQSLVESQKSNQLDVLINSIGSYNSLDTIQVSAKQFDVMQSLNVRLTFLLSKICHDQLKQSVNPHIINISPPLDIDKQWFKYHLSSSMSIYSMSMCTLGMAAEFKKHGIAVNSLWSQTNFISQEDRKFNQSLAEAAYLLSQQKARRYTGQFLSVEDFL